MDRRAIPGDDAMKSIGATMKLIWNPKPVRDVQERRGAAALKSTGGWIRKDSRRSIKKGTRNNKKSIPGRPPLSHTKELKSQIFFAYQQNTQSVIIGPQRLVKRSSDAPRALEMGGPSTTSAGKKIMVRKRPYMVPALNKAIQMGILTDNIKKQANRR